MRQEARFALVTGAGSGIGKAVATLLVKEGWTVGVADVNGNAVAEVARKLGAKAVALAMDVTNGDSVQMAFNDFGKCSGNRLDLLVNNAGLLYMGHFDDQTPSHIAKLLAVNNLGVALCCQAALPLLKLSAAGGQHPTVVNLASASAVVGIPGMAIYSASKFWVKGFTEALSSEWRRHGIVVRDVFPPFVNTPMLAVGKDSLLIQRMGVNLEPDEVARQILKAAKVGPLHRYITWNLKSLLLANSVLPAWAMRAIVARLGGY